MSFLFLLIYHHLERMNEMKKINLFKGRTKSSWKTVRLYVSVPVWISTLVSLSVLKPLEKIRLPL